MAITQKSDPSTDLTTVTCEGPISAQDVKNAMQRFYAGKDSPATQMVLWDLSRASTENLSVEELDEIAQLRIENKIQMKRGKTAIVAPQDLEFGMVRMLQAKTSGTPRYLMVFRTLDEANQWLTEK